MTISITIDRKWLVALFMSCFSFLIQTKLNSQVEDLITRIKAEEKSRIEAIKEISYIVDPNRGHNLFLFDGWESMFLLTKKGQRLDFKGRFNVLNNVLEAKLYDEVYVVIPSHIQAVVMDNRVLITESATKIGLGEYPIFFEVLSTGRQNLLYRFILGTNIEGGITLSYESRGSKKYVVMAQPFYTRDFEEIKELRLNRKSILEIFADRRLPMEKYIKKNRINLRHREDLIQVFNFYNQFHLE